MKKRILTLIALALAAMFSLGCGCAAKQQKGETQAVAEPAAETQQPEAVAETEGEQSDAPKTYQRGEKVEDFTLTLCDGTEVTLSGLLAEKKAVLINVWATYCGPCRLEFPFMQQAYDQVSDKIAILAVSGWEEDTSEAVLQYKTDMELSTLPMGWDPSIANRFANSVYPTSVLIDRNGVVCFIEEGSMPDTNKFLRLFAVYTAADYSEPVLLEKVPAALPDVEAPSIEALNDALGISNDAIKVSLSEDPYAWPFCPSANGKAVEASNGDEMDSFAELILNVTVQEGETLAFEYATTMLPIYDIMIASVDGKAAKAYSDETDWATDAISFATAGQHTVVFRGVHSEYSTDPTVAMLRNVRILSADAAAKLNAAGSAVPEKTLKGTACEIEVLEGDVKDVSLAFSAEGMDPATYPSHILQSDTMTLRIKLGDEIEDALAYVMTDEANILISTMPRDAEGYLYIYQKMPEQDGEMPRLSIQVYPNAADRTVEAVGMYEWCRSESEMDRFVDTLLGIFEMYGMKSPKATWTYDDGTERQEPPAEAGQSAAIAGLATYSIAVTDESGSSIEGVMLQICDESTCQVAKTDGDGLVTMTMTPYPYEIHVLMAPNGYERTTTVYTMPEEGGNLVIKLKKVS